MFVVGDGNHLRSGQGLKYRIPQLLSTVVTSQVNDALPVNVLTRPDGGTHVQAGPINVLVNRGDSIFKPFGLFVDVP